MHIHLRLSTPSRYYLTELSLRGVIFDRLTKHFKEILHIHAVVLQHGIIGDQRMRLNGPRDIRSRDLENSLWATDRHKGVIGLRSEKERVGFSVLHFPETRRPYLGGAAVLKFHHASRQADGDYVALPQIPFVNILNLDLIVECDVSAISCQLGRVGLWRADKNGGTFTNQR